MPELLIQFLPKASPRYEILLVNDGSPDTVDLETVLRPYRDRIIYIKQDNRGQAGARNTGLRNARGEFVCFLDNDDQWEPEFLSFQTGVMQADRDLAIHYCNAIIFGDTPRAGRSVMEFTPSRGEATFRSLASLDCTVLNCGAMSRREAVLRAGMFDETMRYGEDIHLWLRIACQGGRIGYQRRILARCRLRPDSVSTNVIGMTEGYLRALKSVQDSGDLSHADATFVDLQMIRGTASLDLLKGKEALRLGDTETAIRYLERANLHLRRLKISLSIVFLRAAPRLFLDSYRRLLGARNRVSSLTNG